MDEEKAIPYIFSLYQEHDIAIQKLADAKCRHNRSEAMRRMIEFAAEQMFPALGLGQPIVPSKDATQ